MTTIDCIALLLTFAAVWLASELWWACDTARHRRWMRERKQRRGKW